MKTIGIVGGMGPESTAAYYSRIIARFNTGKTDLAYPEIIIYSVDFARVMQLIADKNWNGLKQLLLEKLTALQQAGADFAAIASNTPHIIFADLAASAPLPLLSIVNATRDHASSLGIRKAGLLGTALTMASDFYQHSFNASGMAMLVPTAAEQKWVQEKIFSEIELGIFTDATRDGLLAITSRMINEEGIDGLVLGCTELPLILTESHYGIPFLDTMDIHCNAIVHTCLNEQQKR